MSAHGNKTESRKTHKSGSNYEYGAYIYNSKQCYQFKCGIIKYKYPWRQACGGGTSCVYIV